MPKLFHLKFAGSCSTLPQGFWSAVDVWIKKPHVVNKRLCGVKETESRDVSAGELRLFLADDGLHEKVMSLCGSDTHQRDSPWSFSVRTFIPKTNCYGKNLQKEAVLKDVERDQVTFIPFEEDAEGNVSFKKSNIYQIQLCTKATDDWALELHVLTEDGWVSDGIACPNLFWLSSELLPKLVRWATESRSSEFKSTLSLLPVEKYSLMYQHLKEKYKAMVKVWPEVTDPEKFVYEDVAIASYLLVVENLTILLILGYLNAGVNQFISHAQQVLWAEETAEKNLTARQSFVDLGCGNGLLVHILTNEGNTFSPLKDVMVFISCVVTGRLIDDTGLFKAQHPGKGIDVRRRRIWDMYGPQTVLQEKAITPSETFLFPNTDWLIGNHSDELTPWIPVIAARSSYSCRYFVLPCCFFDFYGKYQRRQSNKSQYKEYIDFITEVSQVCGFNTEEDCMRIPSTKRVCLLGKSRSYQPPDEAEWEQRRTRYIQGRGASPEVQRSDVEASGDCCHGNADHTSGGTWGAGFQPRDKVERVRNCASLPRDFIDKVVLRVANALLEKTGGGSCDDWNQGGSLSLSEAARLLEPEALQLLKKECGGLQTLLKNNYQVFKVEGGVVYIRDWRDATPSKADRRKQITPRARKTRSCWFHDHHPQGCPLHAPNCAFAHGPEELQPSTRPLKKKMKSFIS